MLCRIGALRRVQDADDSISCAVCGALVVDHDLPGARAQTFRECFVLEDRADNGGQVAG